MGKAVNRHSKEENDIQFGEKVLKHWSNQTSTNTDKNEKPIYRPQNRKIRRVYIQNIT